MIPLIDHVIYIQYWQVSFRFEDGLINIDSILLRFETDSRLPLALLGSVVPTTLLLNFLLEHFPARRSVPHVCHVVKNKIWPAHWQKP